MKFYFSKTDSLHKILKTLEKLSPQKTVEIFIDPEHGFFENHRWGQQLKEIISKRSLQVTFLAQNEQSRRYFQQVGLKVNYQEEKPVVKFLTTIYHFFFNIRKFHLHTYNKQKYVFYMVFSFELLAGLILLWFMFLLILPSVTVTLKVAQHAEDIVYNFRYYSHADQQYHGAFNQISVPYYNGELHHQYKLAISTENIRHLTNPSAGFVHIHNKTSSELKLVPNTKFVTEDGLLFLSRAPLTIPPGTEAHPSQIKVKLYSSDTDTKGKVMGEKSDIPQGTHLTIKNLKNSFYLKNIRAESIEAFTGGSVTSLGTISENDRIFLAEKIRAGVYWDKLKIVSKGFNTKGSLVLLMDHLIKTHFDKIAIEGNVGDKATTVKGSADVRFDFFYFNREDIVAAFTSYVQERQFEILQLISIDPTTLVFIPEFKRVIPDQVFTLPTKVTVLQGYDFSKDMKRILPTIKDEIAGMTVDEARRAILQYPEVASTKIKLGVFRGMKIPTVKSRIHIKIEY